MICYRTVVPSSDFLSDFGIWKCSISGKSRTSSSTSKLIRYGTKQKKNLISGLKSDFFILADDEVGKVSEIYSEHQNSFSFINLSLFSSGLSKSENID